MKKRLISLLVYIIIYDIKIIFANFYFIFLIPSLNFKLNIGRVH